MISNDTEDEDQDIYQEYDVMLCEFCSKKIEEIEVRCFECGNKTEGDFCRRCNKKLEEIKIISNCPDCGKILNSEIYCIDCGKQIGYNQKMCFNSKFGEFYHLECP
jgi:predicted amidophosphoribosyltransferase